MGSDNLAVVIRTGREYSVTNEVPGSLEFFVEEGGEVLLVTLPNKGPIRRFFQVLRWLPRFRNARLVVSESYFTTAYVSLLLWLTRGRAKHIVAGLNISSNRIFHSGSAALNRIFNLMFRRIDLAIVASRPEVEQFHRLHDIPRNRFSFLHWAYDLPQLESNFVPPERPYFCLIGRNNRDQAAFCEALRGLDAEGVIITQAPADVTPPENVRVLFDLPLGDCIGCIRGAVANVVLVKDQERGAVHITMVTAMHCARPQIVTGVPTVLDYVVPGRHVLSVPLGDVAAVRAAFEWMLAHPAEADRMGEEARDYAGRWLSAAHREEQLTARYRAVLASEPVPTIDPGWLAAHEALVAAPQQV